MIGFALKHKCMLSKYKDVNYDGTYTHSSPIQVKCYREDKLTKVVTSNGEEVMSKTNYFTTQPIGPLDLIDGNTILSIETYDMLNCKYYRSYT